MTLTRTEQFLATVLALVAADRTGALCRTAGYSAPDPGQVTEMTRKQVDAITHLVTAMREPGECPTADEIDAVLQGLAEGALLGVMGQPPDVLAEQQSN
jgi:hypothetical protein